MTSKPISRLKDEPRGVWYETKGNLIQSKYGKDGKSVYVQPYVEQVYDRLRRELYDKGYTDMDMFSLVSGFRSKEEQDVLFQRAVEKYGSEAKARKWVAKVSPHNTGAAIDVHMGYRLDSENVGAIQNTPAYQDFASYAYHNYKLAPYDAEPWHWECGEACQENLQELLRKEQQPTPPTRNANVVLTQNVPTQNVPTQQTQVRNTQSTVPNQYRARTMQQSSQETTSKPKDEIKKNESIDPKLIAIGVGSVVALLGAGVLVFRASKNKSKKTRRKR